MAEELDLGRSTTHRYATTLVTLGYLERGPSRKYRLSSRVSDVGLSLLDSIVVRRVARQHLRELRTRTGRTTKLGVLGGTDLVYIDRWHGSRQGQYAVDAGTGLGTRSPVHCTAAGKALLARLPAAEQQEIIVKLRLAKHGPKTITGKTALRTELERIAADGMAIDDQESLAGRRALATTVLDSDRRPVAAVEVAVPATAYIIGELVEHVGPVVSETAGRISAALGH